MKNTVLNPQISVFKAELRIIQIGNKQMTISAFNQLYVEKCFDDFFKIIYPIWGKVHKGEEWVIFQKNNELRKMIIPDQISILNMNEAFYETWKCKAYYKWYEHPLIYSRKLILNGCSPREFLNNRFNQICPEYLAAYTEWMKLFHLSEKWKNLSESTKQLYKEISDLASHLEMNYKISSAKELDSFVVKIINLLSAQEKDILTKDYQKYVSRCNIWNAMVDTLHNSLQIFIAV